MESRSNLIKSKSSNSAITTRSGLKESTRSNLQFQRNVIKKRGVYVEHKATKTRLSSPEKNSEQGRPIKSPPRPPPGSKRFLASVLTILSKSTAATQYPDNIENNATHSRQKPSRRRLETPAAYDNQKKKKFRSKVLKKGIRKDQKDQPIIVLQPEKEMAHTSSIFSVSETPNFMHLPSLVKKAQAYIDKGKTNDDTYNDVNNSLVREILEGKQTKQDRRVRIEEPSTVVGKFGNIKTGDDNNNGLYNFFVDLLGTINIQDVVDKGSDLGSNASSPKIQLEMNESVAKKLNVKCHSPTCGGTRSPSPESHFFCLKDGDALSTPTPPTNLKPVKKKIPLKAQSFSMPAKAQPKLKSESFTTNTKAKVSRKRRKENLLNMFKEQLKIDDAFEEPQNLYEALKIIADNKRKCQKTIHFEEMRSKMRDKNRRDSGFPECVFRRPWVLGTGKKRKVKKVNEPIAKKQSQVRSYGRVVRTNGYTTDVSNESQYSIKVIGYDYEVDNKPKPQNQRPVKEVVFTYHSSTSSSDRGLGSNDDELESTDGYFNTFSRAPIDGF